VGVLKDEMAKLVPRKIAALMAQRVEQSKSKL
jgi:hypothetical protein